MWCTHHKVDSHNTADCKALQGRAQPAQRVAAARSAQSAAPRTEQKGPQPTLAELQELWDAHHESMQGLCAKGIPTSVSCLSGHYNTLPGGHSAAPLHSELTAPAKKNERLREPQTDMPLGFLPKDFLSVHVRPPPGTLAAPNNSTKEPVAKATPVMTVPAPTPVVEVTPMPAAPATLPPADTRDLPAGFEELTLNAPMSQGMIYGPSIKETQAPSSTEDEPAPAAATPISSEEMVPLATPVVTHEARRNFGNLYDAQNPQLAAMLSKLPGNYHSDRTVGFHRSPRIDNSGPKPAMLINGRVVTNLLLDCGVEAIITGRPGAAAMGITPDMIQRNAIVIRTAIGEVVRLDQTKKPVSCTLNPGTADEVTVMAHVVVVKHDLPDTLIGMSVIGPAGLQPCVYKQRLKYYIDRDTPNARKAFLRGQFPIDFGTSATNAFTAIRACTRAVIIRVKSPSDPSNPQEVQEAQRRIADFQGQSLPEVITLFDRSMAALRTPPAPVLPVEHPAYKHIRPLDTGLVDKRHVLSAASSGMVVVELCSGLRATTEALLRQGVRCATRAPSCWKKPSGLST
jgi:hypothetical protein